VERNVPPQWFHRIHGQWPGLDVDPGDAVDLVQMVAVWLDVGPFWIEVTLAVAYYCTTVGWRCGRTRC
jgi:hypothetical protein